MEHRTEILEELKSLQSPLADISRQMPFELPEGYFTKLPEGILAAVQEEGKPLAWSDSTPFTAPAGYFESLPHELLAKAKAAEQKPRGRRMPLAVFMRAAAAVLLLVAGIAGYRYFSTAEPAATQQLVAIPDAEISSYLETQLDEMDTDLLAGGLSSAELSELENIGNEEIINYLNGDTRDTTEYYN